MHETLGQYLQEQREQQGISLERVSEETHIRLHYLRALEQDDYPSLPSPVQAKGFLRLISSFLHLDPVLLLTAWEQNGVLSLPKHESFQETPPQPAAEQDDNTTLIPVKADEAISLQQTADLLKHLPSDSAIPHPVTADEIDDLTINDAPQVENDLGEDMVTADEMFRRIGEMLKTRRKMMQMSLKDAENLTHIRAQNLESMEESRFDRLPAGIQTRGMLQSYSQFLAFENDEILNLYAEALQIQHKERLAFESSSTKNKKKPFTKVSHPSFLRKFFSADLIVGSILIMVIIGVGILSITKVISTNRSDRRLEEGITQTNIAALSATPTTPPKPTQTSTPSPTSDVVVIEANETVTQEGEQADFPINPAARIQVNLVANQRTFLRVTVDGEVVFNGRTVPGNAYQYSAEEQIDLLCGNGSALSMVLYQDQKETVLGTLGNVGQVVQMSLRPDMIITPTALPTLTPTVTNTPQATATMDSVDEPQPTSTP